MKVTVIRSTSIFKDSRTVKLVRELLNLGYDVSVLGWDRLNEYNGDYYIEQDGKRATITFFKKYCAYGGGIKNIFKSLSFQKWIKHQVRLLPKYSCLHCCDFDTARPAYKVKGKRKFVYDLFDYFSESRNMPSILKKVIRKQENELINKADAVVICTEQRIEQIKGCTPKKLLVIHNTPNVINTDGNSALFTTKSNKFKVVYIGVLAENRLLDEIFNESKNHPEIELQIGGIGKYSDKIKQLSVEQNNIVYYGSLNYEEVLKIEKQCDVLFATYDPSIPNHKYSAPNKFYEAGALSKPIIVCENTGVDKLVKENDCGIVIDYNAKSFYDVIDQLSKDKLKCDKLGENGNIAYNKKFSWTIMQSRIKELYDYIEGLK